MGWIASIFAAFIAFSAFSAGSFVGGGLALIAGILTLPPVWARLRDNGAETRPTARWSSAIALGVIAMAFGGHAFFETPEGKALAQRRAKEDERKRADQEAQLAEQEEAAAAERFAKRASGEHCLSGWDGSLPPLKSAVRDQLRNPSSFEHIETGRGAVDADGTFPLVMRYRAQNGFGGMNSEAIAVIVTAQTCSFRITDANELQALAQKED